ncbi:TonB-dependent vitamin B12 receptor BtuB [Pectobacterium carotovorum]|uniref:TonB-dependent vitamin B12 receptor BtuB n=1 Tax=Pectobacterium carotovorum TaxID=554 RepID=UPI002A82F005|nr:TonB-dependent vitamin B12 receptor BtuB [Pectobacterium carotovorum]MDY4372268.1 TonB-dependent vitamin B12 receptor BtuB [Pectobacterium carotovorum subsp. carotovorum]
MIKKVSLLTALSVTAFSGWAQENSSSPNSSSEKNTDDIVVTANRFAQPVSSVLAAIDVVTRDDINRWQAKNVLEVMRRLPGVNIAQTGGLGQSASMYIRGSEARHTLVLIDGVPIAKYGITGDPDFNLIPIALVQRIEFMRGPRSAVYGADAIGGVVNIITQTTENKTVLNAGAGSNRYQEYSGSLHQSVGDSTRVSLAGAYQDTRGFNVYPDSSNQALDSDKDGWRNKTFWAGVEHQFNDSISGFFRGYGYGANSDYDALSQDFGFPIQNEQQSYNHTYSGGLRFSHENYASQLIASYQKYTSIQYLSSQGRYGAYNSQDDMDQQDVLWGNTLALSHGMVSAGVDWRRQKLTSEGVSFNTLNRKSNRYKQDNSGAYLTAQQQYGAVILEGSVRGDDNEKFGRHGTWQLASGWEFFPDYRVTLSYATGFQAPTLGQLYGQKRFDIESNENLKPEESKQWEAGLEGLTGPLSWRLSGYINKIDNLIAYEYAFATNTGTYYNVDAATMKGLEWTGSFETGVLNHQITLDYLDARNDENDKVLARRAKQQAKYQIDWNLYDVDFNLSYQYVGKRFDNAANTRRLPSYSTVDLAASYPITSHLTVRGRIANLFDKDYETAYGYRTAGREYYLTGSYTF